MDIHYLKMKTISSDFMTVHAEDDSPAILRDSSPGAIAITIAQANCPSQGDFVLIKAGRPIEPCMHRANRLPLVTGEQSSARMS